MSQEMNQLVDSILCSNIGKRYIALCEFASVNLFSLLVLAMRIWIGKIFWYSGLAKFSDIKGAIFLFENEYRVPFINPEIATYLAMSTELIMPFFIVVGLFSRLFAIPLLFMTIIIEFTYLDSVEHLYWGFLTGTIILYGPGKLSIDYLVYHKMAVSPAK